MRSVQRTASLHARSAAAAMLFLFACSEPRPDAAPLERSAHPEAPAPDPPSSPEASRPVPAAGRRDDVRLTADLIRRHAEDALVGWAEQVVHAQPRLRMQRTAAAVTLRGPALDTLSSAPPLGVIVIGRGASRTYRVDSKHLAEQVEAVARDLVASLSAPEREGVTVERDGEDVVVRRLPASAAPALVGDATSPRYREVFATHLRNLGDEGPVRRAQSTVAADDDGGGAHARLDRWLTRLAVPADLRVVLSDVCGDHDLRWVEAAVAVASPLHGSFVRRAFVAPSERESGGDAIFVHLTTDAGARLMQVLREIAPGNAGVMLTWSDRVMWSSWFTNLHPFPGPATDRPFGTNEDLESLATGAGARAWTEHDLLLHGSMPSCNRPSANQVAARILVVAMIEGARADR